MTRVLVTGATGFVGRTLCQELSRAGFVVRAALHTPRCVPPGAAEMTIVGDIGAETDWREALRDVTLVVHLAARAHVINDSSANSNLYFETNAQGTRRLAEAAAEAGLQRVVLLSSVKVNGEATTGRAYTAGDVPSPQDDYGRSKYLAEKHTAEVAAKTAMEAVIVRAPLVYGPGVRANFLRLLRVVDKRLPLPFGAIENRRSLVSVWNLCDFLVHVLRHSAAPGRIWMISDDEDLSTPDLVRRIGGAMGRPVRLLPVPTGLLNLVGTLTGKGAEMGRLCGSLAVDVGQTRRDLAWSPPIAVDEGIARTVNWYLSERDRGLGD